MSQDNLDQWGQRLEAGDHDLPTLALAADLQASRPPALQPSGRFRAELRARLLEQYQQPNSRLPARRGAGALAAAICLTAVLLGITWTVVRPTPILAAEIVQRAASVRAAYTTGTDLLYERFTITFPSTSRSRTAVAERWLSADKMRFRYQLTDTSGTLIYFIQRNGDQLWQSFHTRPIGEEPVTQVYQVALDEQTLTSSDLLERSVGLLFHPLWQIKLQCEDLHCLLQQQLGEAQLIGTERAPDGRSVYVVQIQYRAPERRGKAPLYRLTLKIDTRQYALVEVVDEIDSQQQLTMSQFTHEAIAGTAAPSKLFAALPPGVVVADRLVVPGGRASSNRVHIETASLAPGTTLEGPIEMEVEVSYSLATAPKATLSVGFSTDGEREELGKTTVSSNERRATVRLTRPYVRGGPLTGEVRLYAWLVLWNSPTSFRVAASEVSDEFFYLLPKDSSGVDEPPTHVAPEDAESGAPTEALIVPLEAGGGCRLGKCPLIFPFSYPPGGNGKAENVA